MADVRRGELQQLVIRQHGRGAPLNLLERKRDIAALLRFRHIGALDACCIVLLGQALARLLFFEILARAAQLCARVVVTRRAGGRRLRAIRRRLGHHRQGQQNGEHQCASAVCAHRRIFMGRIYHQRFPLLSCVFTPFLLHARPSPPGLPRISLPRGPGLSGHHGWHRPRCRAGGLSCRVCE